MDHEVKVYDSRMPAGLFALLFLAMTALLVCAGMRGWQYAFFSLFFLLGGSASTRRRERSSSAA